MGSIGFEEMLLVGVVAILAYGKDLPRMARKIGRWYSQLKRQVNDAKDEVLRQIPDDDEFQAPPGGSPPDAPGHRPPLPGPDPSDPESKAVPFDPAKPPAETPK